MAATPSAQLAGGGFSPLFSTVVSVDVVVSPWGVDTVFSVVVDAFSAHPVNPSVIAPRATAKVSIRDMFRTFLSLTVCFRRPSPSQRVGCRRLPVRHANPMPRREREANFPYNGGNTEDMSRETERRIAAAASRVGRQASNQGSANPRRQKTRDDIDQRVAAGRATSAEPTGHRANSSVAPASICRARCRQSTGMNVRRHP